MTDTELQPRTPDISESEAYMQMAEIFAKRSKAHRLQVGCIIVKDRQIISDGYNGTPPGQDNCCEVPAFTFDMKEVDYFKSKPDVLHAESNAITKLARNGGPGARGATLYVTHAPCVECAKLIIQAGICLVFYRNLYRSQDGLNLLMNNGVKAFALINESQEPD